MQLMSRIDVWAFFAPPFLWLMLDRLAIALIDDHLLSMRVLAAIPVLPGIIAEAPIGVWKTLIIEVAIWFSICSMIAWLEHFHFSCALYPELRKQFRQSFDVTVLIALAIAL